MNRLLDLRFVIGLFFSITGLLLVVYGLLGMRPEHLVNVYSGGAFIVFGVCMIALSFRTGDGKDD